MPNSDVVIDVTEKHILETAQRFVDWVFDAEGHESLGKVDRPEQDLSEE